MINKDFNKIFILLFIIYFKFELLKCLPKKLKTLEKQSWPPMETIDIWGKNQSDSNFSPILTTLSNNKHNKKKHNPDKKLINNIISFDKINAILSNTLKPEITTTSSTATFLSFTPHSHYDKIILKKNFSQHFNNKVDNDAGSNNVHTQHVAENKKNNKIKLNVVNKQHQQQQQKQHQGKVLNFFPISEEHECLSDDGRRYGTCLNPYECHLNKGNAKGECALGFGVCCVFIASCGSEISANNTYIVSPNFPSFMTTNATECKLKIKMMSLDISQLRIDFHHFLLGQPDRKTGICDGDSFTVVGGPGGNFTICGYNSGQHAYYDVGGRAAARQALMGVYISTTTTTTTTTTSTEKPSLNSSVNDTLMDESNDISSSTPNDNIEMDAENGDNDEEKPEYAEIIIQFRGQIIQKRFWEIQISQIPFSQRAPAGCLQYFRGEHGVFQTFNFADNGRHLANQNYRACFRQEIGMCSILYEPCDTQSFRIGPTTKSNDEILSDDVTEILQDDTTINPVTTTLSTTLSTVAETTTTTTTTTTPAPTTISGNSVLADETTFATNITQEDEVVEGSGAAQDEPIQTASVPSRRPRPSGGFDFFEFFREAFDLDDFNRRRSSKQIRFFENNARQLYSTCTDRITLPCIIEDFIADGNFGCEPVHCGNQFCSLGNSGALGVSNSSTINKDAANNNNSNSKSNNTESSCRIESTVTPFFLGVHFGDGIGKGSPEDNIGACLKFNQIPCL